MARAIPTRNRGDKRREWALSAIIGAVAAFVVFYHLGTGSIWRDEAFTVELSKLSWSQMSRVTGTVEGNMWLFYACEHLWLGFLRLSHLSWSAGLVRVPNAVAFVAASLTLWRMGRHLLGLAGGTLVVAIWWAFPWVITYSQQARSFSFFFFFTALSFYALMRWLETEDPRRRQWLILFGVATLLNVYSFLDAAFYTITQVLVVTALWRVQRFPARQYAQFWMAVGSAAILAIPLVPSVLKGGQVSWVPLQSIAEVIRYPNTWLELTWHQVSAAWILLGLLLACGGALWYSMRALRGSIAADPSGQRPTVALIWALVWGLVPLVLEWATTRLAHDHILDAVYALPAAMALALGAAAGWTQFRWRSLRLIAAVVGVLIILLPQWHRGQGVSLEQWRDPVLTWARFVKPTQALVFYDNYGGIQYTVQYFIDADHLPIQIRPYPGHFTWPEYVRLRTKQAYFTRAVSLPRLQRAGILQPGHEVWFGLADGPQAPMTRLNRWLAHHAVVERRIAAPKWPVTFILYRIRGRADQ